MSNEKRTVPGTYRTKFVCRPGSSDHVVGEVHGVKLPIRIWPANKPQGDKVPWLMWIHGGGFQSGNHYAILPPIHGAFGDRFHIVSVSYRYLPEVGLREAYEDCLAAIEWCQSNLPSIIPSVDLPRYVVGGDSAGGTLSTLMGHFLEPRPTVVLDIYGLVDAADCIVDPGAKPPMTDAEGEKYQKELGKMAEDRDPSHASVSRYPRWLADFTKEEQRAFLGLPNLELKREDIIRDSDLYDYVTQHHLRFDILARRETCKDDDEFHKRLNDLSAHPLLDGATSYPPTFILHGTGDATVPVEQSYQFEKKLKAMGVDVGAHYPPGEPHSFDQRFNGPEDEGWEENIVPMIQFVEKYI